MIQPILSRMAGWRNSFHIFGFTKNILQQIPHNMSTLVSEYQGTHLPTEVCTRGGVEGGASGKSIIEQRYTFTPHF